MAMTEGGDDVDALGAARKRGAAADRGDAARERDMSRFVAMCRRITSCLARVAARGRGDPVRALSPHNGRTCGDGAPVDGM